MKNDHYCERCNVSYILFSREVKCPNCQHSTAVLTHEHYTFIPETLKIMQENKRQFNKYAPDVFTITSLADYLRRHCLVIFDKLELQNPDNHSHFLDRAMGKLDWHDNLYLKIHFRDIIAELHKHYTYKKPKHSLKSGFKSLFYA